LTTLKQWDNKSSEFIYFDEVKMFRQYQDVSDESQDPRLPLPLSEPGFIRGRDARALT